MCSSVQPAAYSFGRMSVRQVSASDAISLGSLGRKYARKPCVGPCKIVPSAASASGPAAVTKGGRLCTWPERARRCIQVSMHPALQLLVLWLIAFLTLAAALVLLNLVYNLIGYDLMLRSRGQEITLALVAAFIEGGSLWAVANYVPMAGRALILPAIVIVLLYRLAHLEDWNNYDAGALLLAQLVVAGIGTCLFTGHILAALLILVIVGGALALIASVVRSL
jgi:hypothetical protein